jgi:hypothetical protein
MVPRLVLAAVLAVGLAAVPGSAQDKKKQAGKADAGPSAAKTVGVLQKQRVTLDRVNETTLIELLQQLAGKYDVTFVIRDRQFKEAGVANIRETKLDQSTATKLQGLTLHRLLATVLADLDATYLVRNDYVEIVTKEFAAKEAGLDEAVQEAGAAVEAAPAIRAEYRTHLPLVCVAADKEPLADVFKTLARVYDLNIVVHKSARLVLRDTAVTEQLLNVPADTALELLADQAEGGGLTVVRKGNTFLITAAGGMAE